MKKMIVAGICVIGALALTGCGGKKSRRSTGFR